jgi:Ca2+/Na+ antiporter
MVDTYPLYQQMGLSLARPECNIPSRLLIGVDNASAILQSCAAHKRYYALGFCIVVTLVLLVGYFYTRDNSPADFQVPFWLTFMPALIYLFYSVSLSRSLQKSFATENIEYQLSGMSKRDYLNYKIGDDRAAKGFAGSATSAGILASSGLLGPFIRADTR